MGRELKRVALDFDWPLGKTWEGFLNPHCNRCPNCESGCTPEKRAVEKIVRLLLIAGDDSRIRPKDFKYEYPKMQLPIMVGNRYWPHPYLVDAGVTDTGEKMHELSTGLAGREPTFMGHDAIDAYSATKKVIAAAGLDPETWGICPVCEGSAEDPASKKAADAWEETPPPAGEGWQVWETVSEGSPITPVFKTADELIDFMCSAPKDAKRAGWAQGYSREAAEHFVRGSGWAPSAISAGGQFMDGVTGMHEVAKADGLR